jgi:paraquat-inducible protein B
MPSARDVVDTLVKKGLRATMVTGNLLTGELLISLDFLPNAPPATVTMQDGAFVFPTSSSGGLSDLQASAGELLRNVNAIPFASIGKNLDTIIANVSGLTNGPQLKETLTAVAGTMTDAQSLVKKVDADIGPFLKQLPEIAGTLETTLKQSNTLIRSVNNGYGDETQFHRDLDRLMTQLNDAVRSFRALADLLTRHPEALVRGRTDQGTP